MEEETIDLGDYELTVPYVPERVYLAAWPNGVQHDVWFLEEPLAGHAESDRIYLRLVDKKGLEHNFLMNIEDANSLIIGLSLGIRKSLDAGVPVRG